MTGAPLNAFSDDNQVHLISTEISGGQLEIKDGKYVGAYPVFFERAASQSATKIKYRIVPWARAVRETERSDKFLLFPFTRTPEREKQFTWLVKLNEDPMCFASVSEPANTIAAARELKRVIVWRGTSNQAFLEKQGFQNLIIVSSMEKIRRILKTAPKAAWYTVCEQAKTFPDPAKSDIALKIGDPVSSEVMWLVGGKSLKRTPDIDKLAGTIKILEKTRLLRKLLDEANQ